MSLSDSKRVRLDDDTCCSWDRVLLDRTIFTTSIIAYLPRLEDRAALACTSHAYRRFAARYDAVLRQMWATWAVPSVRPKTRMVLLLESQLLPCIQWVHAQRHIQWINRERRSFLGTLTRAVAYTGYMEGVHYLLSQHDHTNAHEYKNHVIQTASCLFRKKHVEKAVAFYSAHCAALKPSLQSEHDMCIQSALRACHPLADAHVRMYMNGWTELKMRESGFWAGLLHHEDDVIRYHWNKFTDVRQAISSMEKVARFTSRNAIGRAFAMERALEKGVTAEEFNAMW